MGKQKAEILLTQRRKGNLKTPKSGKKLLLLVLRIFLLDNRTKFRFHLKYNDGSNGPRQL
jgi:hypothetical protein